MVRGSILVGYDGSDAARRALVRAGELAAPGGEVLVTSVTRPLAHALDDELYDPPSPAEATALLDEAATLLQSCDGSLRIATRTDNGDPAEALMRNAVEAHADLIVVGARGRSFVARTLLGSVTEKLVAHAPCDVLVVR